jgi:hypothetical protein
LLLHFLSWSEVFEGLAGILIFKTLGLKNVCETLATKAAVKS